MKIGIISDTHDLLRPEVMGHLQDCDCVLHGGDISSQRILDQLEQVAPVRAVRGNNDKEWAEHLPLTLDFELGGLRFFMTHTKKDLPGDLTPYDLVIYGHSHKYDSSWQKHGGEKRTLLLNPGSCGPRRFHQPVTMAKLTISEKGWEVTRIDLSYSGKETVPKPGSADIRTQIEMVVRETQKGLTVAGIAEKHNLDPALVEQIARLYVTHPGVTVDGIMAKMGL